MKIKYIIVLSAIWFYTTFHMAAGQILDEKDSISEFEGNVISDSTPTNQHENSLSMWLALDPNMTLRREADVQDNLNNFCKSLTKKKPKFKTDINFLWYAFNKIHTRFLDFYTTNQPFYSIFSKNSYNCVSGTALYAIVLNELGYVTTIKETSEHVYLIIILDDKQILIESTDAIQGFILGTQFIEKREKMYAQGKPLITIKEISLVNLCGLQYYNEAVRKYGEKNYDKSLELLERGKSLYPNSGKIWSLSRKIKRLECEEENFNDKISVLAQQKHTNIK